VFHIFSAFYKGNSKTLDEALNYAWFKIEEKYKLVDLNEALKHKARVAYDLWKQIFDQAKFDKTTPDLYK
jgi:hypothetical protein